MKHESAIVLQLCPQDTDLKFLVWKDFKMKYFSYNDVREKSSKIPYIEACWIILIPA